MVMKKAMKEEEEKRNMSMQSKYKGVRKRKWGKWVSEIRLPHSRERIWLGSYDTPEKAARAFDAAQFCLRGVDDANFNFPDNPPFISGGRSLTPPEIQEAASRFANSEENSVVINRVEDSGLPGCEIMEPGFTGSQITESCLTGSQIKESCLTGFEIRPESPCTSVVSEVATSTLTDCDFSFLDLLPMDFGFDDFSDGFSGDLPIDDCSEEILIDDSLFLWDF